MAELFSTNFPIYSIDSLNDTLFYVAGGGGKAKTGVPNFLELYKLECSSEDKFNAVSLCKYDMKDELIMQSAAYIGEDNVMIAASVGRECHIYDVKCPSEVVSDKVEEIGPLDDDINEKDSTVLDKDSIDLNKDDLPEKETNLATGIDPGRYTIVKVACVTTDEASKDSCQNVVRFIKGGSRVLTAGEDGIIRVWSLPVLKPKEIMEGHKSEVTNLVVHPNKQLCVSLSRDCSCRVWDLECFSEIKCLKWTKYGEYRFRSCCFSDNGDNLFTINIPLKLSSKNPKKSYLCKWDTTDWTMIKCTNTSTDILTTVASRGNYVAVGNIDGDISVFTSDLKRMFKSKGVHTSFITGLCFIPVTKDDCPPLLLSTSVDKRCCITTLNKKDNNCSGLCVVIVATVLLAVIVAIVIQMGVIKMV